MNEYIVIVLFVLWYTFALVVSERMGKQRKIGVEWSFFVCILFSPLVGYFVTKFSPAK